MLVLASASPRRKDLLAAAGIAFRVEPAGVAEDLEAGIAPDAGAVALAIRKARAAAARLGAGPATVLGADTVVALPDGRVLGKPADRAEAESHLRALAGTTHTVFTGVCLLDLPGGAEESFCAASRVTMRAMAEAEVRAYAASGIGLDKAGAYALQEGGDRFVTRVEGSRSNVVGLPVEELLPRLAARGIRP